MVTVSFSIPQMDNIAPRAPELYVGMVLSVTVYLAILAALSAIDTLNTRPKLRAAALFRPAERLPRFQRVCS